MEKYIDNKLNATRLQKFKLYRALAGRELVTK